MAVNLTKIEANETKQGFVIKVKGHNEKSICASISTLVAAFEGWLMNNCPDEYQYQEKDGYCEFKAPMAAKVPYEVFIIGVMRLERNFPEKIKVIIK